MILIQAILILGILLLFVRFFTSPSGSRARAWKKIFGVLFVLIAVVAVLFPETANDIAHVVGVGRGADLLLYLLTLAFIFLCLNLYIKSKQTEQRLVTLGRKIALLEAKLTNNKSTK